MKARSTALLTILVLGSACRASTAPTDPTPFQGRWHGQEFGTNIYLRINAATPQSVAGLIAFSSSLAPDGCGSATPADSIRQGQFYADSLVFRIPLPVLGPTASAYARVMRSGRDLSLAVQGDPEIQLARC
jgi:hypothetical protein